MIRNFKVLGVAVVAVLAMSAVVASAASAAVFKNPEGKSFKVEATQVGTHIFTVEGSQVTCENATFTSAGELPSGSTTATVHPVYTGCTGFGFLTATVTTTGCDYVFHQTKEESSVTFRGDIDIVCSGASKIVVVGGTCEITIGSQNGLTEVMTTNNTTGIDTITLEGVVPEIAVTKTADGFLCPLTKVGATTGVYVGDSRAIGKNAGTQVDITVN